MEKELFSFYKLKEYQLQLLLVELDKQRRCRSIYIIHYMRYLINSPSTSLFAQKACVRLLFDRVTSVGSIH